MAIVVEAFGTTLKGEKASRITLENKNGMILGLTDYGAAITEIIVPDRNGEMNDVCLGCADVKGYEACGAHFGATIGRNGNRMAGGAFVLNGRTYQLDKNDGENNLHSGSAFYDKRLWTFETDEAANRVIFHMDSPDGDQGFPGRFVVSVFFTLTDGNSIVIDYDGISDQDTVANMTNHCYFNLGGHEKPDCLDHLVWIDADATTELREGLIATGRLLPVDGGAFDFRREKSIGRDIEAEDGQLAIGGGYDHNFVLNHPGTYRKVAAVRCEESGRRMEVWTDLPGMQFYAGNFLGNEPVGKDGVVYPKRSGFCMETQGFPNAVNIPEFPSVICKAGERYQTRTEYRFSAE